MSGHSFIDETLKKINKLGIRLAMDDFGTGYSSLNYLRKYPFDILKIDRSFVSELATNAADKELINATIGMAKGLDLRVIAEGVETQKQLDILSSLDCHIAQGYLFSRPISKQSLFEYLSQLSPPQLPLN